LLTRTYFFVELAVGGWAGSVAVMPDALHTFPRSGAC
jgi:Co/Zn/Cd efflux system component